MGRYDCHQVFWGQDRRGEDREGGLEAGDAGAEDGYGGFLGLEVRGGVGDGGCHCYLMIMRRD